MIPGRHRRRRRPSRLPVATGIIVAAAFSLCSALYFRGLAARRAAEASARPQPEFARTALPPAAVYNEARPVYPFSVIPGGAYSPGELVAVQESDEVVARHFQVFQRARLRMVQSAFAQPVYVSYRMRNAVFWTRRPVRLREREKLLTDGALFARARCGNRISVLPREPVAEDEPPPEVLDMPESAVESPPAVADVLPPRDEPPPVRPAEGASGASGASGAVRPRSVRGGARTAIVTTVPSAKGVLDRDPGSVPGVLTPEPGSFILLLAGISTLAGAWLWRKRRRGS